MRTLSVSRARLAVFPRQQKQVSGGCASRQPRRSVADLQLVNCSEVPTAASRDDGEPLPLISSGKEWNSFVSQLAEQCVILFDDDATQHCLYPEIGHAASAHPVPTVQSRS